MTEQNGAFPDDEDGAVLASLAEAGVDLAQPIEVEFVIDAPDEPAAGRVAAAVREARTTYKNFLLTFSPKTEKKRVCMKP